ncbi:hypothetical protein KIN20_019912 [Parelaphostrongylus tenuis]|uniref:Uncharacterized protein n=1 Tax=Parelaphostrongylus tenuis TaxID=148309 RepID=A0AAD5MS71_PARTN|nr:hypothetical protein KIN20_019912 [Parelaphostrongylus tenuis]
MSRRKLTVPARCSSTHLRPQPSFSSIVSATMKANLDLNAGSVRCVSSAIPMSTSQRKELWGTSLHHSFEKKTHLGLI